MSRVTGGLIAALLVLSTPTGVAACTCSGPRNALEARSAVLILKARVIRMEDRGIPFPEFGEAWSDAREPVEVEVEVERSWNGRAPRRMVFTTGFGGGDCGYGFSIGVDYVIPLYESSAGELVAGICGGVQTAWDARNVLPRLGRGHAPLRLVERLREESRRVPWGGLLLLYTGLSLVVLLIVTARVFGIPRGPR